MSLVATALLSATPALSATYEVIELQPVEGHKFHFANALNNNGDVIGLAGGSFNFKFYKDAHLNDDTSAGNNTQSTIKELCDISDAEFENSEYDADSTYCIKQILAVNSLSGRYQKVGDVKSFYNASGNQSSEIINLVDYIDEDLQSYTLSNEESLLGINDAGVRVGMASAPFNPISFQQTGENASETPIRLYQQDYTNRGFINIGDTVTELPPVYSQYGGQSAATGISNTNYVSGLISIDIDADFESDVNTQCTGELTPVNMCAWLLQNNALRAGKNAFKIRPVVWQLDETGAVVDTQVYGLGFEETDLFNSTYYGAARSVNDAGIAVGYGSMITEGSSHRIFPMVYKNGEATAITGSLEYFQGFAVDVNNNNIAIGKVDSQSGRKEEFFVYDIDKSAFSTPETFFKGAQSRANAINDNGIVIGEAEYEYTATANQDRRKHGFVYNINTQELDDINNLIECRQDFEIVSMRDINNNNQIVATALKKVEKRDALGAVVIDEATGKAEEEQITIAVLLNPIEGEKENCVAIENPPTKRKGLSMAGFTSALLLGLVAIRRRWF